MVWFEFIVCTLVILAAGTQLSKYGDIIAEKTGLGRTWIGVVLLASVTSLPELITGASSVLVFDLPEIAVGDILGSCMFNILIIAVLDFSSPRRAPISSSAHQGQVLTAGYAILLIGMVAFSIKGGANLPVLGWFGVSSVAFVVVYLLAMRMVFRYEKKRIAQLPPAEEDAQYADISKRRAYFLYAFNAVFIIAAATWLPHLGDRISEMTGLGNTFVGSVFIALSTSLPELVITVGAIRIGAIDLALGNLFGSNLFNIGILAIDDFLYTKGALLAVISSSHLVSAIAAIMMTAIAVIGLTYRTDRKFLFLAWDSVGIVSIFAASISILYAMK
ncbi:MAG TPA: hypothetical protein VMM38_09965 [Aridibacter sp.]|nr:hypothetical protein [Aridibacter sp.]